MMPISFRLGYSVVVVVDLFSARGVESVEDRILDGGAEAACVDGVVARSGGDGGEEEE